MKRERRILLIEDDEMAIKLLSFVLEKEGYMVIVARDGNEGFEAIHRNFPDVIIMAIMLPFKSGMELISIAKDRLPEAPIIVLSSLGKVEQTIMEAKELGVAHIVAKPFNVPRLLSKIREILSAPIKKGPKVRDEELEPQKTESAQKQKAKRVPKGRPYLLELGLLVFRSRRAEHIH